jgi:sugar phosphate isomerase/epimerase
MVMKFSVFTASTPEWSPQEAAQTLAAQGWDGIEWRITDQLDSPVPGFWQGNRSNWALTGIEANVARIAEITSGAGLEFSGIGGYARSFEHDDVERMLAVTAELGAGRVRVTMPQIGTANYRELFSSARTDLEWVTDRAAHYGVKALIELHHRTITASASAAYRLIEGLDPDRIGVIHDLGNLVIEGQEDHLSAFELLGPYLAHIHVKNVGWFRTSEVSADGSVVWKEDWATLRGGVADVDAYFRSLARFGYDGWVTLEDFSTELPLIERTADNLSFVREAHARAVETIGV